MKKLTQVIWGSVSWLFWLAAFFFFFFFSFNLFEIWKAGFQNCWNSTAQLIERDEISQHLSKQNHCIWIYTSLSCFFGQKYWTMFCRSLQEMLGTLKKWVFFMSVFSRVNTKMGWDTVMLQGTKRGWRLHSAVNAESKQQGIKKPRLAPSPPLPRMFNTAAKAGLQGRSIEIPGCWD